MDFSRFDYGALHEDQRARLGIGITDINGERWGYIRVREAMKFGQVVRSSKHTDLVTTNPGEVFAAASVGSDKLTTNNGFQLSNVTQDLRGAIGLITTGDGVGQNFYILENDNNTAKVFVLTGSSNRNKNAGWVTRLTTASRFLLFFPGEGRQGERLNDIVEGVIQTDVGSNDLGKFCWVKRSGATPVLVDGDGTAISAGESIIQAGGGEVEGLTTAIGNEAADINTAREEAAGVLGRALAGDFSGNTSRLVLAHLNIPDGPLSYAYARTTNAFNEATIR